VPVSPVTRIVLLDCATVSSSLKECLHRPAATQNAAELIPLLELRSQIRILRRKPALFDRLVEHVSQLVEVKRLGDESGRSRV
jgi:hypothetical protein